MIDINLNGTLYFARLAVAYLKEKHNFDSQNTTADDIKSSKCITLVASVAGFKESPGLFAYSAAKHGVVGLMRALRGFISQLYGLRVNAICTILPVSGSFSFLFEPFSLTHMSCLGPWATDTQLLSGVRDEWTKNNMPMNTPGDVAKYIIQVTADQTAHGKALFVTGGNAVDIEEGLNRTEPQWLGEKNSRELNEGQVILGLVSRQKFTFFASSRER